MARNSVNSAATSRLGWSMMTIDSRGFVVQASGDSSQLRQVLSLRLVPAEIPRIGTDWNSRLWTAATDLQPGDSLAIASASDATLIVVSPTPDVKGYLDVYLIPSGESLSPITLDPQWVQILDRLAQRRDASGPSAACPAA